jgi:hypothetical protein
MPTFAVESRPLTVFALDKAYVFKHYFDQQELFAALEPYYDESAYCFEVPEEAFAEVETQLEEFFYAPEVVADPAPYCVVYPRWDERPTVLNKAAVCADPVRDHVVFLMKDQLSVEQAVHQGATPLDETELACPF